MSRPPPTSRAARLLAVLKRAWREARHRRRQRRRCPHAHFPQYEFGKWTYGIPRIHAWGEGATLKVGAFCSLADGVQIFLGGEHRIDWVSTFPFSVFWDAAAQIKGHPRSKGDVIIGNDVWIGHEAIILSGVRVGDGAVIGARAVVSRDVPPYHIVAGNPATIVRARFAPDVISRLLATAWWTWDDARIERALPYLTSSRIDAFLDLHARGEL